MRPIRAVCVVLYLCASLAEGSFYVTDYDVEQDAFPDVFGDQSDQQEGGDDAVRGVVEDDSDGNLVLTVYREDNVSGGGLDSPSEESVNEPVTPDTTDLAEKIETSLMAQLNQTFAKKITELEEANKKLQEKIDRVEQQTKTNSVVIYNVPEGRHENHRTTLQKVLHVVNRMMKVSVGADDIAVALRADTTVNGAPAPAAATGRPIVVRFVQFATKMKVMGARGRLARSKVSVSSDYSEGVAAVRAALVPFLEAARARRQRAFVLYDRLVVNGVRKTLQQLQAECARKKPQPEEQNPQVEEVDVEELEAPPQFQDDEYEDA